MKNPDAPVKVDLASQTLTLASGRKVEFPVDGFPKHCLLEGIDELGYIQQQEPAIEAYEASHLAGIDTRG
jgi:3-isopropylmalate/(R)-2-methylmalate dehydratase small subunit